MMASRYLAKSAVYTSRHPVKSRLGGVLCTRACIRTRSASRAATERGAGCRGSGLGFRVSGFGLGFRV
jgi:hypothetical protein